MKKKDEIKRWCELVHLLGVTLFIGPLIVYLAREEKEIKKEAEKVLNWQFSLLIYLLIVSVFESVFIGFSYFVSFTNLLILVNIILSIIAYVKVSQGQKWEYPLTIKFFK